MTRDIHNRIKGSASPLLSTALHDAVRDALGTDLEQASRQIGVMLVGRDRRIVEVSPGWCELLGIDVPPDELVGADGARILQFAANTTRTPERTWRTLERTALQSVDDELATTLEYNDGRTLRCVHTRLSHAHLSDAHLWILVETEPSQPSPRDTHGTILEAVTNIEQAWNAHVSREEVAEAWLGILSRLTGASCGFFADVVTSSGSPMLHVRANTTGLPVHHLAPILSRVHARQHSERGVGSLAPFVTLPIRFGAEVLGIVGLASSVECERLEGTLQPALSAFASLLHAADTPAPTHFDLAPTTDEYEIPRPAQTRPIPAELLAQFRSSLVPRDQVEDFLTSGEQTVVRPPHTPQRALIRDRELRIESDAILPRSKMQDQD